MTLHKDTIPLKTLVRAKEGTTTFYPCNDPLKASASAMSYAERAGAKIKTTTFYSVAPSTKETAIFLRIVVLKQGRPKKKTGPKPKQKPSN